MLNFEIAFFIAVVASVISGLIIYRLFVREGGYSPNV